MSIAALIRNMAAAGASPEAIAIAVEAIEGAHAQADAERAAAETKRADARERKRRERARKAEVETANADNVTARHNEVARQSRDMPVTVTGQNELSLALPSSPQTPQLPTHTRKDSSRARRADRFEEFWTAYPLKKAKIAAKKRYDAAIAEISGEDPHGVIMAGLARAVAGWSDPKYVPHPSTWLNQGRWADEVTPVAIIAPLLGAMSPPVVAVFDGPSQLRESVLGVAGEAFAVKYIDQCRWDAATRTLLAKTGFAADEIRRELRQWLAATKVNVGVAGRVAQPEGAAA